uniref:Uncharacterized protein n=1 Tax=Timema tahoe TaxID=61484 RepID=A0A7R9IFL7_9NEOP|nr:unnamed protein product [Timema tahoe]
MPLTISVTVSENNRHLQDVTTLLFKDEKLYSAAEDGIVKVWDPHLRFLMELRAHESVVFHLATIGDTLYTCSNDGTIKAWDIDTLEHKKTLLQYDSEVWRFFAAHGRLYAGDVKGIVRVYENDELVRIYDLTEEVRDMAVSTQLLYTVRDRDVVITELLPGPKGHAVTRKTIEGSSPMCLVGDMICFVSRSARDILVHDNNKQSSFKELGKIQAHEMIINTLCPEGDSIVYSGGYDAKVKKWDMSNMKLLDSCDIGRSISALSIGSRGQVYVAGSSGYIARLDRRPIWDKKRSHSKRNIVEKRWMKISTEMGVDCE